MSTDVAHVVVVVIDVAHVVVVDWLVLRDVPHVVVVDWLVFHDVVVDCEVSTDVSHSYIDQIIMQNFLCS